MGTGLAGCGGGLVPRLGAAVGDRSAGRLATRAAGRAIATGCRSHVGFSARHVWADCYAAKWAAAARGRLVPHAALDSGLGIVLGAALCSVRGSIHNE